MPNLKAVILNLPPDGDISFVRHLPNLQLLDLLGEPVKSLAPLRGHKALRRIILNTQGPLNLKPLLTLPKPMTASANKPPTMAIVSQR